jgi:CRP-like cAMP-binding protein
MALPALLLSVGDAEREAITACLRTQHVPRGQTVFNDGDRGDCLYLVRSGRLDVQVGTPAGQLVTLRVIHPGELFGELALVHPDNRRTGRVTALERTELSALFRRDFESLRRTIPSVDQFLVAALAERVVRTSELAVEMLLPPETRIWRRLAVLADAYGAEPITMSQETLAQVAGTVRQTANRVLQAGVRDGIVALGRGTIAVLDRAAIDERARA